MNAFTSPLNFLSLENCTKKEKIALLLWVLIALFCIIQSLITHRYNNYLIFENTFRNLLHQQSFYAGYPLYHFDENHYGPIFSVFFMPFALLPNALGFLCWNLFNVYILFKAVDSLPIKNKLPLYYIALPCIASATLSQQFNPASEAFIILTYTLLNKDKGVWSTMLIALGTFIKLYGIIGLAFFFFVKDKKRFVIYLITWSCIFFVLPMLFSSPSFIIESYKQWAISLIHKNTNNILGSATDISNMGFIRNIFVNHAIPNTIFLLTGIAIFGLPFLNFKAYRNIIFQLYILASALLFPVLFSTGSEDCTYIIAVSGVGIWYIFTEKGWFKQSLLAIVILFSCDFPLLLFPNLVDKYPILLSMLSFPFFVAWILIIYKATAFNKEQNMSLIKEKSIQWVT